MGKINISIHQLDLRSTQHSDIKNYQTEQHSNHVQLSEFRRPNRREVLRLKSRFWQDTSREEHRGSVQPSGSNEQPHTRKVAQVSTRELGVRSSRRGLVTRDRSLRSLGRCSITS